MLRIKVDNWKRQAAGFEEIGQGGEATIWKMRDDVVGKVFLQPNDPQFKQDPKQSKQLQEAARVRIEEMQKKISKFPKGLPSGFVVPTGALVDKEGKVFGYTMPFIKGTGFDKLTRTNANLTGEQMSTILSSLHKLVTEIHAQGVVIGDFNENNIIVDSDFVAHIVDTDSSQFGNYFCRNFMPNFVAPELVVGPQVEETKKEKIKTTEKSPEPFLLLSPHTELTDWYSFLVMAMRLITSTGPYGGVLKDMDLRQRLAERATVFDRRVTYPMNALPLADVPRPLLELFFRFFHKGERFVPELDTIQSIELYKSIRRAKRR